MLDELQEQARKLYRSGEYLHALADFSVLREVRARREGPYSVKYLANLHDCVRCMLPLRLWADMDLLCSELYSKYSRTHGRGDLLTVDVAKLWAWAMVHLRQYPDAARLYLVTADAIWERDPDCAEALTGAAAYQPESDARTLIDSGTIDGIPLIHPLDLAAALNRIDAIRTAGRTPRLTVDGLAQSA